MIKNIFYILLLSGVALGSNPVPSNTLKIGDGNASNKLILFNNVQGSATLPAIRWNQSSGQLEASNNGTLFTALGGNGPSSSTNVQNLGLKTAVATNAMTVTLTESDGATAPNTGTAAVNISFRNPTATTGGYNIRSVTSSISVVIASGATLGLVSGQNQYIYVYALDNVGTVELAVSGTKQWEEGSLQNTTAMSGSATSNQVLYSTVSRSSVPIRLIGRLLSNQTASGTYASNAIEVSVSPFEKKVPRSEVWLQQGNGFGSINGVVRRFTTAVVNVGTGITYTDSATLGASFSINEDGVYSMGYTDTSSGALNTCITLNATGSDITSNPCENLSAGVNLMEGSSAAGAWSTESATKYLRTGDVIRFQNNGTAGGGPNVNVQARITKVSL